MAYTTAQYIQNLQVGTLSFTPSAPAGYSLYTNSIGQTYWGPALDSQSLSTFSTAVYTYIDRNDSNIKSTISSVQTQINTGSTLANFQSSSLSSIIGSYELLSTLMTIQNYSFFNSTITVMNSTLYGFSTFSSFFVQINALDDKIVGGLSNYSTTTYSQNSIIYLSTLTLLNNSIQSTMRYIDTNITNLGSSSLNKNDFNTFSSVITSQMTSSSVGQTEYVNMLFQPVYNTVSTLTFSTTQFMSSYKSFPSQISSLQSLSTNLCNTTYTWISSYVSKIQSDMSSSTQNSLDRFSTNIGLNYLSNQNLYTSLSNIAYSTIEMVQITDSNVTTLNADILSLKSQFNTFTTTGVLANIYNSFMQLEEFSLGLVNSTIRSVNSFQSSLYYSTSLQNMSISKDFYNSFVSSLYNSTLSTLNHQTTSYTSSLISTLYVVGYNTLVSSLASTAPIVISSYSVVFNDMLKSTNTVLFSTTNAMSFSTLKNIEVSTNDIYKSYILSTNVEYNKFLNQLNVENFMSTLYTNSTINLHDSNVKGIMDFHNYRNINVNIYNLSNGQSNYSLTYDPDTLIGYDYIRGFISINVSTINNLPYTNNGGKLQFDVYRWGIPTTVWGSFFPTISQGDYSIHYDYTIINKTLYANLINVYPRLSVSYIGFSSFTSGTNFPKGSNILVSWSNYSGINLSNIGIPFNPTVSIETYMNNTLIKGFGPYPFNSNTVIQSPSIAGNGKVIVRITGLYDSGYISSNINII